MSDFSEYYANEKDAVEYRVKIIFFTLALFTQGDEIVRDKLYCALGHCKNKCGGCDVGEE